MDVNRIVSELDTEIARLQHIRAALTGIGTTEKKPGRGRPKGSKNLAKSAAAPVVAKKTGKKRKLSPEGRKRIAEAMKRRWAERRKEAGK